MRRAGWPLVPAFLALVLVPGCSPEPVLETPAVSSAPPPESQFNAARAGTIRGQVTWKGPLPAVAPLEIDLLGAPSRTEPNPHQPRIHPETRGIAGTVVYLKNVDPTLSRPWNHGPVWAGLKDGNLRVEQGGRPRAVGFARQGDTVELKNEDTEFVSLRLRGAAFCSLPFVHPGSTQRRLEKEGHVEVSCGSGEFWRRAHLFVSPHPYICLTDEEGRFHLDQVPEGSYEIHCWLPNWEVEKFDFDPELRRPVRMSFQPPLTAGQGVQVRPGGTAEMALALGNGD